MNLLALPWHVALSSLTTREITIKNAEPNCVQQQTSEDGVQALNLINVASESSSARDTGLQVALAQEGEAANIECTQVPITEADPKPEVGDQVDFCSSFNPRKPKAKSTRKRKANKESCVTGGNATFSRAKGNASGKEGIGADANEDDSKASN